MSLATGAEWWEVHDAPSGFDAREFLQRMLADERQRFDSIKCRGTTSRAAKSKRRAGERVDFLERALSAGQFETEQLADRPGRITVYPFGREATA
jgi:hypothetical protein